MSLTIFNTELNDFCRKYLLTNVPVALHDRLMFPSRLRDFQASLFEQLLLFDKVALKVFGENIPLAVILNAMGERAFDELMEQGALSFVLWTPMVLYMKSDVPGVYPLASGNINPPLNDPEQSIELGLNWLQSKPSGRAKRRLIKKLLPLYIIPDTEFSPKAVGAVHSGYNSGRFEPIGLSPKKKEL